MLHGIDRCLARGEFAALVGPSGSGKSTLLNIIGLLEKPSAGKIFLTGQEAENLADDALTIGFVFQFHNLLREVGSGGTTFLIVTHDPRLAARCDRLIDLVDGRIPTDKATVATGPEDDGKQANSLPPAQSSA